MGKKTQSTVWDWTAWVLCLFPDQLKRYKIPCLKCLYAFENFKILCGRNKTLFFYLYLLTTIWHLLWAIIASQAQGKMESICFIQWQKTFKRHCILVTLAHFWMVSFVFFSIAYTVSCSLSKLPCLFCRENNWWRILIPQNNDAIAAITVLALLTVHVSLCSTDFEGVGS